MAEEAAQELEQYEAAERDDNVGDNVPPSIADVAMRHALLAQKSERLLPNGVSDTEKETEPDTDVVIDLRSTASVAEPNTAIEIHLITDAPAVLDIASLAPIELPASVSDRTVSGAEPWESSNVQAPSPTPAVAATPNLGTLPLRGLAVASIAQRSAKRATDIFVASLACFILLPFLLLVAFLVKTTSRGPVLYRSRRIGKGGEEFDFVKFRSMSRDAAHRRTELLESNEQSGPVFKIREDPRITSFGRFIRRASIDELPQLFHVLSGKMSLVGPRPALPNEVLEYDDRTRQRLAVKPGITCIWQVSGRSELSFETWVDMDLDYIRNWTLLGDFQLLARTLPAVFTGKGAY